MEIPDGVIDLIWELKDEDTGDTAFLTFQIVTDDIIQPNDILQYKNTWFKWDNRCITVMESPNEHMVCAHKETLKIFEKTCKELEIDLEEHNINLMPLEEFTPIFEDKQTSNDIEGEEANN